MRPFLRFATVATIALMAGCASLPPLDGRTTTTALADTSGTRLGKALGARVLAEPGKTGIHPLFEPRDAFAARVLLATAAERSLDVQYYIWHDDEVGYLLFEALWRAAERGVRVRLLLDDMTTGGLDPVIAALDAHPSVEVRLYNPFVQRDARALAFVTDFQRVNRRMHNKSFTADNQVSVVGGRNIGNEYFAAGTGVAFADLDVVAVGEAVRQVSAQFDLFWNSPSAYPAANFVGTSGEGAALLAGRFAANRADPDTVAYVDAVRRARLVDQILDSGLPFEWTSAKLVHDDPAKTLASQTRADDLLFPELVRAIGRPTRSLDLVSPYFVPGENGTAALAALARSGVQVRILTNSLSSSDESIVHAGYAPRRYDLLRAGVRLFELRPTATRDAREERPHHGSSASAGLHAKTFAVDRERIFVGSFNFDQRSALLNTEVGLVIHSPRLAGRLGGAFDTNVPLAAWEVRIAADGRSLEWIERGPGGETRHATEPGTTRSQRMKVDMLSILPIEWLL
jgi:putative cardiolipin synthase